MTWEIGLVLLLAGTGFVLMVSERLSPDLVAMLTMGALLLSGVLTPSEAFQVFSSEAAITVACMFILSAALEQTGLIAMLARRVDQLAGRGEWQLLVLMLPSVALISAFLNNTPIVVIFMPVLVSIAARRGLKPSKLLIPLSYAAILGGCCTLVGTSTNILVSEMAVTHGAQRIGMFEMTAMGSVLAVAGLVYLLTLGRRLLPARDTLASLLESTETKQYLTEAVITRGSPLIGRRLADTPLRSLRGARILDITRGGELVTTPLNEVVLQQADRLRVTTVLSSVMELQELKGVEMLARADLGLEALSLEKAALAESVVGPNSQLIGKTIRGVNFRQRYGILILAVHRQGRNLRQNFEQVRLRFGDTILLEGADAAIQRLREDRNFLLLADVPRSVRRLNRMPVALGILMAVVVLAALHVAPISVLTVLGVLGVILTGCLGAEQAYASIPWRIMFMIFGMMSLGIATEKTGAAQWLANGLVSAFGSMGPAVVLSAMFLATSLLTEFISNNAVAVLLTPVAIATARDLGVDPKPFVIAVAFAASASFSTPIGYQTNTLVYGAGGYKFSDFARVGAPLNLLYWLLASLLIPVFWPF